MRIAKLLFCSVLLCLIAAGCGSDVPDTSERPPAPPVVVYAARDAASMRAVLDAYTEETGITVLLTTESGRALIDRLSAEKHRPTADLVLTDSIGHLWRAVENDILRPSTSETLEINIPENLRDPENLWFGLLVFGRTIAYDKREIDPDELTGYSALGDDQWRGKLCLSSATDVDNQSHIAMMIGDYGERPAELTVRDWIANLAIPVMADDAQLLQAIEDRQCGVGIVNSDDVARFTRDHPDTSVAGFWPLASSGGAYINIVGAAVTRHASNPVGARQLLEWLSSEKGQIQLAGRNLEYPANQNVPADNALGEWREHQINPINLAGSGYHHQDAVKLMERARYTRSDE